MKQPSYIFPPHIPAICHPNVNSLASLIQDLDEDSSIQVDSNRNSNSSKKSNDNVNVNDNDNYNANVHRNDINRNIVISDNEFQSIENNSSSYKELKRIGTHCEPFLHQSNLYKLQVEKIQSDIIRYNNNDGSDNSNDNINDNSNEKSNGNGSNLQNRPSRYDKGKITELSTLSKISLLNYRYCLASQSCVRERTKTNTNAITNNIPTNNNKYSTTRMEVLNKCFMNYDPQIVKALFEVGRHDLICGKEKKAVERCIGGLVMNVTRDLCDE